MCESYVSNGSVDPSGAGLVQGRLLHCDRSPRAILCHLGVPAMSLRALFALSLTAVVVMQSAGTFTQAPAPAATSSRPLPPRAIRRDVPLTNAIRRAFEAGTRDCTGGPDRTTGSSQTDYTIDVRLDPATADAHRHRDDRAAQQQPAGADARSCCGSTTTSSAASCRAAPSVPAENTDGMVVTRLAVNGEAVDLSGAPAAGGGGGGGAGGGGASAPPAGSPSSGSIRRWRASRSRRRSPPKAHGDARDRLAHEAARRARTARGHRMTQRFDDTLFQPTQWFPRVAKYDDLRGWDTSLYLGPSEFYNNFGRFDVSIDVPGRLDRERHRRAAESAARC